MNFKKSLSLLTILIISSTACSTTPQADARPKKHYQAKVSKVTADDQLKGSEADIEVTRRIRSRLTDDSQLSISAQNITIVTMANKITLKGEVRDQEEKNRVITHASRMKGSRAINSQLTYTE